MCCHDSVVGVLQGVAAGRSTLGDEVPGLPVPSNSNFTANPLREKSKPHAVFRPDLCPDEAISVAGQRSGSDTADSFSGRHTEILSLHMRAHSQGRGLVWAGWSRSGPDTCPGCICM